MENSSFLLAAAFAVALVLEWRYRSAALRLTAALGVLLVILFTQPKTERALDRALSTPQPTGVEPPPNEPPGFYAGILTMEGAAGAELARFQDHRMIAYAVLFWLAASPVFTWRGSGRSDRGTLA